MTVLSIFSSNSRQVSKLLVWQLCQSVGNSGLIQSWTSCLDDRAPDASAVNLKYLELNVWETQQQSTVTVALFICKYWIDWESVKLSTFKGFFHRLNVPLWLYLHRVIRCFDRWVWYSRAGRDSAAFQGHACWYRGLNLRAPVEGCSLYSPCCLLCYSFVFMCVSHVPHLSWRLVPSHKAVLLAELLHLYSVIGQYVPTLVTFISQKHSGYMLSIGKCQFGIQVLLPFGDSLKGGGPCHVKHNEGAHGLAVVHTGHVAKPLLT